jgi:hypothetical protein
MGGRTETFRGYGPHMRGRSSNRCTYVRACPLDICTWRHGRGDLRRALRARLWVEQARTSVRLWIE